MNNECSIWYNLAVVINLDCLTLEDNISTKKCTLSLKIKLICIGYETDQFAFLSVSKAHIKINSIFSNNTHILYIQMYWYMYMYVFGQVAQSANMSCIHVLDMVWEKGYQ